MGIIDILVIIAVFLSVVFALYRGLVRELLGITSWILAGIAGLYSYSWTQPIVGKLISNEAVAGAVGSIIVAVIVLVIMTLVNAGITAKLRESSLSGLDRILGFAFGIFRAWLLIAVIYIAASMVFSDAQLLQAEEENYSVSYIQSSAATLEKFIPDSIKNDIKSYEQGKLKAKTPEKIGKKIKEDVTDDIIKNITEDVVEYEEEARDSLDALIEKMD